LLIKSQPSENRRREKRVLELGEERETERQIESNPAGEKRQTGRRAAESAPEAGMEDLSVEELASNLSTYKEQLREVSSPPLSSIWPRPFSVLAAILLERSF
jgi:hypothetical protein